MFVLVLLLLLACGSNLGLAEEKQKIRVGYYIFPYFQEIDRAGNYSGYSYDYLQAIAQYTGWEYEYITTATSSECLQMLARGEIDIMGVVQKTPEREALFDYPDYASSSSTTYLVTDKNNAAYAYEDFVAFNNMTVALQKDFARDKGLVSYSRKNGFAVKTRTYATKEEFESAIHTGVVDAGLISSNQINPNYRIIAKFDPRDTYYVTTKGNKKVLAGLNYALKQIKTDNPHFDAKLYDRHYNYETGQIPVLSKAEREYVKAHPMLRVLYDAKRVPYEYTDADGHPRGISIDIMENIAKAVGVKFEYTPIYTPAEKQEKIDSGAYSLLSLATYDYNWANRHKFFVTQPYLAVDYVAIYKEAKEDNLRLALPRGYYVSHVMQPLVNKYGKVDYYESIEACIEAVDKGEADYTFANLYECEYYLSRPKYRALSFRGIQLSGQEFSIGVIADNNPILYSILTKGLKSIPVKQINVIIKSHLTQERQKSFFDMMYYNPVQFVGITGSLVALVLGLVVALALYRVNRQKRQVLEREVTVKSDFLSSMSHDMRTPMNAIIGMSYLGLASDDLSESKIYHKQINQSGKFLLNLINDTLDMNKIEQNKMVLQPEPFCASEFIDSLNSVLKQKAAEKGINFIIEAPIDLNCAVMFDKLRLQQIVINLLNNAIKFTPTGGTVKLAITDVFNPAQDMMEVKFVVSDTGIGMSEGFQKKMYQPFEQEKNCQTMADSGTGLGLSIVHKLVHLMQGTITCHSVEGQGTEFVIILKAKLADKCQITAVKKVQQEETTACLQGKRVLLVEDHPINAQISTKLLECKGVIVDHAENGKEALEVFAATAEGYYDAVLMDIQMPVMDGITVTKLIRKLERWDAASIPIVAMTANAFAEDVQKSLDAGMNAHLSKPVEPERLYALLCDLLSSFVRK